MPPKRKFSSGDGPTSHKDETYQVSRSKRSRREPIETLQERPQASAQHQRMTRSHPNPSTVRPDSDSSRTAQKTSALAAELANLSDYNLPPVTRHDSPDSDHGRSLPPRRLRARNKVQSTRVTKPSSKKTESHSPKRRPNHRSRNEVAELKRWAHWESEAEGSSCGSDSEDDLKPRPISRSFPARQVGVQNVPWEQMPAEMRNMIYEYCIANEEEKALNVNHYPHGIPRRSGRGVSNTASFAHSYWGFTQTCQHVRAELTPWLVRKRYVRTRLATLNDYINTFHRPDPISGKRIGNVEPICTGAPLPEKGVEVLELFKQNHESTEFRLQLTPTSVNPVLDALEPVPDPLAYDELKIIREIEAVFKKDAGENFRQVGINSIRILSVAHEATNNTEYDEDCDNEEQPSHDIRIELDIIPPNGAHAHRNRQISDINHFVFQTRLALKSRVQLHASVPGGIAEWKVRPGAVVDMGWKSKKKRGASMYRRLTARLSSPNNFDIEYLD